MIYNKRIFSEDGKNEHAAEDNMIKIFLVEDEVIIRNGIKNSINWAKEGYEFVGEAGDGELAYPKILKEKPDILLTDIKMPFMDGLELSAAVKKELPDIKIIILSGYNDFDFAKRGIEIGITNYLLKPISAEALLKAIGEVAEKIRKEREEKEQLKKYEEDLQGNIVFEKQKLFTRILTENMSMPEMLEEGHRLGMDLGAGMYNIILFKFVNYGEPELQQQLLAAYMQVASCMEKQKGIYVFPRDVKGWAFLLLAADQETMDQLIEQCRQVLEELLSGFPQVEYFGGIGTGVSRLRELRESFREAEKAFSGRFIAKNNQIVTWAQLHEKRGEEPEVTGLGSMQENRQLIAKFLRNGTEEETESFVQTYFDEILGENIRSMMMRQYVMMDLYINVISFGGEIGISEDDIQEKCGDIKKISEYTQSVENMSSYVEQLIDGMLKLRDGSSQKRYLDVIETAKTYMNQQYMSDDISLGKVAASVGMSPSYFSSVFSQETGQTFVEYLTTVRMEKAKELLMCSGKKTSEVGFEVGYKDAHYFSYIFKKTQGCSPKEYRARRKEK